MDIQPEIYPAADEDVVSRMQRESTRNDPQKLGHIVSVEPAELDGHTIDVIRYTMGNGTLVHVPLQDAFRRAKSLLQMLKRETGSASISEVEKELWLCRRTYIACIKCARAVGVDFPKTWEKRLFDEIKHVQNTWRDVQDRVRTTQTKVHGFGGQNG